MLLKPYFCQFADCVQLSHAWFSFSAQFVRFDVLRIHCLFNHLIDNNLRILKFWCTKVNTALLSFIASNGCHSNNCSRLPCSLPHVLLVQYFECSLSLQSTHQHEQQQKCSCNYLVKYVLKNSLLDLLYFFRNDYSGASCFLFMAPLLLPSPSPQMNVGYLSVVSLRLT